ncbi:MULTISPECIES: phosphoenolpyruvate carboxylase [Flavobacterium]|uniref:Phosphoenolpyruvate carboxylase n=2 Tax=Flavobacterium TaxID=237 RepID=A0A941AYD2_9FLAO|nr:MULTISPECIES: phosphoenolpyruvate carboxylase [Flavobacterium]MBP4139226.1 phosphoenolpyruvate carboxylase [Flavobacterium geliluteum]MDX6182860.1 phosphoenolpyruvate carboxylase [Flavobacterium sp. Fl-33]MDX6186313.1 phosphoenolpyruvate carboxylase [Flavobacterium sp. Fl-77]UFH37898.1 phosphoenolpyruvate carboxylase [Flavobacterium sp. F-70]
MYTLPKIERFNQDVLSKYHIYNSVFITLPFDSIDNTGVLLPLFTETCETGFKKQETPKEIFNFFSDKYLNNASETEKIDLMFRFIQYIERQIVLFDAIEDAAFPAVNNMEGRGSLRDIKEKSEAKEKGEELVEFLENFNVRTVLTAHPTQFYPGPVLGIINDLTAAIRSNDLLKIKQLLAQLGKTPFIQNEKPNPYDEAVSLIWYLENVFYATSGEIVHYLQKNMLQGDAIKNQLIKLGFWPGGDRDGNPFVTTEITLKVADRLRTSILKCYYVEMRNLKRKLTFSGVDTLVSELEHKLYRSVFYSKGEIYITLEELLTQLNKIRSIIIEKHQSLYLDELEAFLVKINLFGFHFATLDIRQNSKIHNAVFHDIVDYYLKSGSGVFPENYFDLSESEKITVLSKVKGKLNPNDFNDEITKSTLESIQAIKTIQQNNGEFGANRYIISNNESALNVMETFAMIRLNNWEDPTVDIIPLFESVDDLQNAHEIMEQLYTNPEYSKHLKSRGNKQTIMLGFSDGTKDGGYLMANWSIYQAKIALTEISRKYNIKAIFFDGRGGPPARGGGKTHKFYASLGPEIENNEIQITVQGQTISSNFGTLDSCRYNIENLLSAGVTNQVFSKGENELTSDEKEILNQLADLGYNKYLNFKNHPKFIPYLEKMSTLKYYSKTNIGSRPSKRSKSDQLDFADLRAIPFVGSWSQLKQNVPGFFGVGTALKHFEDTNQWDKVHDLYHNSLFFKTLLENSMMSLAKSFFPLTSYMKKDPEFGEFWQIIYDEFLETKRLLLKIADHKQLMENYPDGIASIQVRERIVLPLLTIQQYALLRINELNKEKDSNEELIKVYEKIVTRSLFGNTNASRNSA